MKMQNRKSRTGILSGIVFGVLLLSASPALADVSTDKHSAYKGVTNRKVGSPQEDYDTLTLDMVRDVGVSLRQVKELAIYIFKEATRKQLTTSDPAHLTGFDSISEKDIEANAKYLKPRAGWLFFYVGTLEPTIQLLKDTESERIYIPRKIKNEAVKLNDRFDKQLEITKKEIKRIHKYIDGDENESVDVARSALAIYNAALEMEKIRTESYEIVRDAENKGYRELVLF